MEYLVKNILIVWLSMSGVVALVRFAASVASGPPALVASGRKRREAVHENLTGGARGTSASTGPGTVHPHG
jgi:hypothetical protein